MLSTVLAASVIASSAPIAIASAEFQQKPSLVNSAIGFWQIGFADAAAFDIVALVRPYGAATVRLNEEGFELYVVQPVRVVNSRDVESGLVVDVYYRIPRGPGSVKPSLGDLTPADVELGDRLYLLVGLTQGTTVRFENRWVVGDGHAFTVPAMNPVRQAAIALNLIEADAVVWSDKEDRREWLLHTIARTMPRMPDKGLRKASWLLAQTSWAPPLGSGQGHVPTYSSAQHALYEAVISAREEFPAGRSSKARLYATFATAKLQQIDPLDTKTHPGWSEMTEAVHRVVVRDHVTFDIEDVRRFFLFAGNASLALEVAEATENGTLKGRALDSITRLETRGERLVFLQQLSGLPPSVRHTGYVKLYKWLGMTEPEIAVTRDRAKRITRIDNESEVVSAIERKLGE